MHTYPTPGPSPLHFPTMGPSPLHFPNASPGPALDHVPGHIATTLVSNVGGSVLGTAQNIALLAVPFLLALAVIVWALHKFGVGGKIDAFAERQNTRALANEHAALEERKALRKARSTARKAAAESVMWDDAQAENRRRNVRHRFTGSYT